jgi:hypothetical protein
MTTYKTMSELAWCKKTAKELGYQFSKLKNGKYELKSPNDVMPFVWIIVNPENLDQIARTLRFNLKHYKNGVKRFECPHGISHSTCINCDDWKGGAQGYCVPRYKATGEKF